MPQVIAFLAAISALFGQPNNLACYAEGINKCAYAETHISEAGIIGFHVGEGFYMCREIGEDCVDTLSPTDKVFNSIASKVCNVNSAGRITECATTVKEARIKMHIPTRH